MSRAALLLTSIVLVLVGCDSTAPDAMPTTSPTPVASATVEPSIEPADGPVPYLDLSCADLVSAETLDHAVTATVELLRIAEYRELSWFDVPRGSAVRQLGGFTCEWSNGVRQADDFPEDAYAGVYVSVLPHASGPLAQFDAYVKAPETSAQYCSKYEGSHPWFCEYNALVDGTWVLIEITGAASHHDEALNSIVADVSQALASARPATRSWTPPVGTQDATLDCSAIETLLSTALGDDASPPDFGGGWSQEAASWALASVSHSDNCLLSIGASSVYVGGLTGGSWAWTEAQASGAMAPVEQFTTPNMIDGEAAWTRCDASHCVLHVVASHGWVRADLYLADFYSAAAPDIDTDLLVQALAEEITRQVHAP